MPEARAYVGRLYSDDYKFEYIAVIDPVLIASPPIKSIVYSL